MGFTDMAILWYTAAESGIQSAIEFDVTTIEAPSFTAEVTDHPIEDGTSISDHVRRGLTRITIEGTITNTPINETTTGLTSLTPQGVPVATQMGEQLPLVLQDYVRKQVAQPTISGGQVAPERINGLPRGAVPVTVTPGVWTSTPRALTGRSLQFAQPFDRVKYVFTLLEALISNGVEVAVDTYLKFYDSMVMTSLSAPRNGLDSISFTMELVEFRRAAVKTVKVQRKRPKEKRAVVAAVVGPKGTGYAPVAREGADLESIERRLVNEAAGLQSTSPLVP